MRVDAFVRTTLFAVLSAAALAALFTLATFRGEAQPTVGPFATNTSVGTTSAQIIAASPSRKAITICNGSTATNNASIAPVPITPTVPGANAVGIALAAAATSNCYNSPSGSAAAGAAWNGIGSAANTNILVIEYF